MTAQPPRSYTRLAVAIVVAALVIGSVAYLAISPTGKTVTITTTTTSFYSATLAIQTITEGVTRPVVLAIIGGSSGVAVTNITISANSDLHITFPSEWVNYTIIKINYVSNGYPASSTNSYGIFPANFSADANTTVNYSFTTRTGYLYQIPSGDAALFTVTVNPQALGNYSIKLWANGQPQSPVYVTVTPTSTTSSVVGCEGVQTVVEFEPGAYPTATTTITTTVTSTTFYQNSTSVAEPIGTVVTTTRTFAATTGDVISNSEVVTCTYLAP
jgi:hypothetical protein